MFICKTFFKWLLIQSLFMFWFPGLSYIQGAYNAWKRNHTSKKTKTEVTWSSVLLSWARIFWLTNWRCHSSKCNKSITEEAKQCAAEWLFKQELSSGWRFCSFQGACSNRRWNQTGIRKRFCWGKTDNATIIFVRDSTSSKWSRKSYLSAFLTCHSRFFTCGRKRVWILGAFLVGTFLSLNTVWGSIPSAPH